MEKNREPLLKVLTVLGFSIFSGRTDRFTAVLLKKSLPVFTKASNEKLHPTLQQVAEKLKLGKIHYLFHCSDSLGWHC